MVRVYAGGPKLGSGLAPTLNRGPKRGLLLRQGERDILVSSLAARAGPSALHRTERGKVGI